MKMKLTDIIDIYFLHQRCYTWALLNLFLPSALKASFTASLESCLMSLGVRPCVKFPILQTFKVARLIMILSPLYCVKSLHSKRLQKATKHDWSCCLSVLIGFIESKTFAATHKTESECERNASRVNDMGMAYTFS